MKYATALAFLFAGTAVAQTGGVARITVSTPGDVTVGTKAVQTPGSLALTKQIIDRELKDSKAYETLSYLTDEIGARPSGSETAAAAVEWTTKRFRSWGIDVTNEKVMVPHWVRGREEAQLVSHHDQKIVLTALGGSVATPPEGITAEVVELTSFEQLKEQGANLKGKIVFFDVPMDMELVRSRQSFDAYSKAVIFRGAGPSRAAEYGAVAVVIRSVASASLRTPHTGALRYDPKQPQIPAAAMTTEDAGLVQRLIARGDKVRMHLVLTPKAMPDVESANVIAEIKGSVHPEEIVVIGGHLDSWDLGTGAMDDGAGVAMVMETMRLFKVMGIKPDRTIRCVLFMNEENGLNGGRQYFADHKGDKHVAVVESDAGGAKPYGFTTTLDGDALTAFKARAAILNDLDSGRFVSAKRTGADTSFEVEAGVMGFEITPDPINYFDWHHTPADTLDKVDPRELAQDSAAMGVLTYLLANQ